LQIQHSNAAICNAAFDAVRSLSAELRGAQQETVTYWGVVFANVANRRLATTLGNHCGIKTIRHISTVQVCWVSRFVPAYSLHQIVARFTLDIEAGWSGSVEPPTSTFRRGCSSRRICPCSSTLDLTGRGLRAAWRFSGRLRDGVCRRSPFRPVSRTRQGEARESIVANSPLPEGRGLGENGVRAACRQPFERRLLASQRAHCK
jgi:hypothetical protein